VRERWRQCWYEFGVYNFYDRRKRKREKKQQHSVSQAWHAAVVSSVIKMKVNVKQKKAQPKKVWMRKKSAHE
jgi:hypothetical protein